MKLRAEDFIGGWNIARDITDMRILESGTMRGQASFIEERGKLVYHEQGLMRFAGGSPVKAERRYIWSFHETHVDVVFADGSPFHSFELSGGPRASPHLCGDDMYKGIYSFVQFPLWQVTWLVEGPRKNYRSVTRYSRI